jgi:hypothetical protein
MDSQLRVCDYDKRLGVYKGGSKAIVRIVHEGIKRYYNNSTK